MAGKSYMEQPSLKYYPTHDQQQKNSHSHLSLGYVRFKNAIMGKNLSKNANQIWPDLMSALPFIPIAKLSCN